MRLATRVVALLATVLIALGSRDARAHLTTRPASAVVVFPEVSPGVILVGNDHAAVPPDGERPPELALPTPHGNQSTQPPPGYVYAGTGPYYGNYSDPGYSAVTGKVWLPCRAARLRTGETGYVYMGGFGAGYDGSAVDAGFQLSSGNHGAYNGDSFDNYALIFKHGIGGEPSWPRRLACNQSVKYTFKTLSPTQLTIAAQNVTTWASSTSKIVENPSLTITIEPWENWDASGGVLGNVFKGVIVKRMVSIAQPNDWMSGTLPTWWRDGSYFGHTAATSTPQVRFTECNVGRVAHGQMQWTSCGTAMRHYVWFPTNYKGATIHRNLEGVFPTDFAVAIDLKP